MNFDNLKKQWDNQSADEVIINPNLEKLESANNVIEDVVKKIKNEFILVVLSFIFLLILPFIPHYKIDGITTVFYYFFMFYILIGSFINYIRFYHFYKLTKVYQLNTSKDMLMKVYYELKYALDTYLVTSIVTMPSGIGLYFIVFSFGNSEKYISYFGDISRTYNSNPMFFVYILALIFGTIIFIGAFVYYMYVKYYGKRLKHIKDILNSLEE